VGFHAADLGERVLPLSSVSSAANSSKFSSIKSASRLISRPLSRASIFAQGPDSNALRAALTAKSISAASPSATWAITSSVAGLMVGNVLPLLASCHLSPMRILVWRTLGAAVLGACNVVAMTNLLIESLRRNGIRFDANPEFK
jgi:hypothetical protein